MMSISKSSITPNCSKIIFAIILTSFLFMNNALAIDITSTGFYYPIGSSQFNSGCGAWLQRDSANGGCYFNGSYHIGVDMLAAVDKPVYAISDGIVNGISPNGWGSGNVGVVIKHKLSNGSEFLALYGHVKTSVQIGDFITGGNSFAKIGYWSEGNHLHFAIYPGTTLPSNNLGLMPNSSWPNTNGFADPMNWITTKRPLSVIKFNDNTVYLYSNNQFWPIFNEGIYALLGFNTGDCSTPDWSYVSVLPTSEKSKYPRRNESIISEGLAVKIKNIIGPKTCTKIKNNPANVYIFNNGKFRHVQSWDTFLEMGYNGNDIVDITQSLFDKYGAGETYTDGCPTAGCYYTAITNPPTITPPPTMQPPASTQPPTNQPPPVTQPVIVSLPWTANFENGIGSFILANQKGTATMTVNNTGCIEGNNCLLVENSVANEYVYQVQAKQVGMNLQNGKTYFGSLYLKAEQPSTVYVQLVKDIDPFDSYGLWSEVKVGTSWEKHSFIFIAKNHPENAASVVRFTVNMGKVVGKIWIDNIQLKEAPVISQTSILKNGLFEDSVEYPYGWELENHKGTATMTVNNTGCIEGNNCLLVENSAANEYVYQVQAKQVGMNLQNGKTYVGSLYLKAEQPSTVYVQLVRDIDPYDSFGLWKEFQVGTAWKKHIFSFTAENHPENASNVVRFSVYMGKVVGKIWVDNIQLKEAPVISQTSILKNGLFEDSVEYPYGWELENHKGTATMTVNNTSCIEGNNCLLVENSAANEYVYQVQAKQVGMNLQNGKTYVGSLYLKADQPSTVYVQLVRDIDPYDSFGLRNAVPVGTSWKKHTFSFTAENHPENASGVVRFSVSTGKVVGKIWIDNIQLKEAPVISQTSILKNGLFEDSLEYPYGWTLENHKGTATMTVNNTGCVEGNNCLLVENSVANEYVYQVQAKQVGMNLQNGKTYVGSLYLKAEQPSTVYVQLVRDTDPFDSFGLWNEVQVGASWKKHTFNFTAKNHPENASGVVRFTVNMGKVSGKIWVDSVQMTESSPALKLTYPANDQSIQGTSVELKWDDSVNGNADSSSYKVYLCDNQWFMDCSSQVNTQTASAKVLNMMTNINYTKATGFLFFIGSVFACVGKSRKNYKIFYLTLFIALTFLSCGGGGQNSSNSSNSSIAHNTNVTDLNPQTEYYWKVAFEDGSGNSIESETCRFTTR